MTFDWTYLCILRYKLRIGHEEGYGWNIRTRSSNMIYETLFVQSSPSNCTALLSPAKGHPSNPNQSRVTVPVIIT